MRQYPWALSLLFSSVACRLSPSRYYRTGIYNSLLALFCILVKLSRYEMLALVEHRTAFHLFDCYHKTWISGWIVKFCSLYRCILTSAWLINSPLWLLMVLLSPISGFCQEEGICFFTKDLFLKFILNRRPANYHAPVNLRKVVNQQLRLDNPSPSLVHSIFLLTFKLGGSNQTRIFLSFFDSQSAVLGMQFVGQCV